MRLNCGPTKEQAHAALTLRLCNWHRCFAWLPVRVGPNDCRWLEVVERKYAFVGRLFNTPLDPEYRAIS